MFPINSLNLINMKKVLLLTCMFLLTIISYGQERTVSGKVTSMDDGESLPGVNVVVKGTTTGTVTDFDGNYNISLPQNGGVLVFSFIGLATQEVSIGSRAVIDVQMSSDVKQLSEVVVTALGLEKESRTVGYGISQVSADELTTARESNIVNSLQGKITGVTIQNTGGNLGGSSKILIRGATSLSGNNNPLWIVDGVPINDEQTATGSRISGNRDFSNGASVINPDDVETINVLKGAAASALYGSRAAAGAIIVTTKKGKSGSGKARVTINSSVRVDDLFRIPDYQQQYAMGRNFNYDSSLVANDWGPKIVGQTVDYLPITGETGPLRAVEDNGVRDFFETGLSLINNISIADADERMDYRLSLSSLNQDGIVPNAELDRITIGLNTGVKHSEKFKSRFGVQYIRTVTQGTAASGTNDPNIVSLANSFSSNLDTKLYRNWIDPIGNQLNQLTPAINNPYWVRHENKNDREDDRFLGNFELTYTPIPKLNIISRIGYDYDNDSRFFSNRVGTAQRLEGNYTVDKFKRTQLNADIIANYSTDLTEDLSLSVLVGYQYNRRLFEREGLFGNQLLVPELFDPGNVNQTVANRDYSERMLMGAYGQAELSYKRWLTLTVTGRNDWSSTLPLENNSYFYPSVSSAFVFTEALGVANNILSFGKLRASFAKVGNDTDPYQLAFRYFPVTTASGQYGLNLNFPYNGNLAFRKPNTIPEPNLLPEEQTSYEFGTELSFFDGRIGLDVSYFKTKNVNQIINIPIPETTGSILRTANVGRVDTEGIEISLSATILKTSNFAWNSLVNFSHSETKVVELTNGVERLSLASAFSSVQVVAEPGKEFQLFGIPYSRDTITGRPFIDEGTGRRIPGEGKSFGSVLPDFTMGFVNNLSYKGVSLSFTVDWRSGGIMKSSTVESLQTGGLTQETARNREGTFIDLEGVIANGDGTVRDNDVPLRAAEDFWTAKNNGNVAEPYIFDASFVKLREVGVSYTLPSSLFTNSFINGLQVGVEGRNLALLFSKVPHIDPEANLFGSGADGFGVERASVPSTRSVGFNVRLSF